MSDTRPEPDDATGGVETPRASTPAEQISREQVQHLAGLARIRLSDEEIDTLTTELGLIVESVAKVTAVAGPDVPATSHPIPLVNVYRPDVPGVTLTTEQALQGAPEHDGSRFKVSAILGEEQ
ncbi:Asp-tRNA(Asn)/Glu-tRNA(Gln) amidotransferase subunit GatC [Clavibacter tessellarius]|uniref:Aspartyl/glutamyl-tRNA(Asn/Gln) amidotransferase subunit C n=1 Tax=Clavibacter tessellarius TaxID=31965 RepID=A0A225CB33_9MICO|nr:Asp-tRNA(Asn)/Glu-tRNA(Gln) amidotransferase subunit GatC [Clavibacter michiganensis]MBT1636710.1 Asp-tRNA(Asn)/Glu-tRNA(Gln) amidotransferase subunit GatC [Clavibacter michiganensis]OQJ63967.1 aspartyl/glutamyl-tRNA(Asn/Gln) amidotransferase subunit C [Clavibacter michiganensis subsp. tessellarius]UKF33056.1 Asp-tRNA(Asn)/Glu-tRNA(Gln) amidotransferase subunit GatC [Clavibacter michiganensis subsp. tessellarius]